MDDLRKAAEMALAKLEHLWDIGIDAEYKVELLPEIEALRQAIEQAEYDKLTIKFGERAKAYLEEAKKSWEQEPVAWEKSYDIVCALLRQAHDILATTQYPIKRPLVSLTDEECDEIWGECLGVFDCLKMTEAKLKEKNNG